MYIRNYIYAIVIFSPRHMNIKMKTKTKRRREAREREKKATRERHTKKLASLSPKKKGSFGVNGSFGRPPGVAIVSLRVIVGD